jgi:hypothetical protein
MTDIDWRAVYWLVNGDRKQITDLNKNEQRAVIRRLQDKMIPPTGRLHHDPYPWMLTHDEIGERIGVSSRTIMRIQDELPYAHNDDCPVCGCHMWVHDHDSYVEPHPDRLMNECPLSNYTLDGVDRADIAVLTARWVATWFRSDPAGATKHIKSLPEWELQKLLVAMAALIPDGDPEELLEWTKAS